MYACQYSIIQLQYKLYMLSTVKCQFFLYIFYCFKINIFRKMLNSRACKSLGIYSYLDEIFFISFLTTLYCTVVTLLTNLSNLEIFPVKKLDSYCTSNPGIFPVKKWDRYIFSRDYSPVKKWNRYI